MTHLSTLFTTAMKEEINERSIFKTKFGKLSGWLTEIYVARGWLKRTGKSSLYYITQLGKKFINTESGNKKNS